LVKLVRVRVLRSLLLHGKPVKVGDEMGLEYHLACDLRALGKCALIES